MDPPGPFVRKRRDRPHEEHDDRRHQSNVHIQCARPDARCVPEPTVRRRATAAEPARCIIGRSLGHPAGDAHVTPPASDTSVIDGSAKGTYIANPTHDGTVDGVTSDNMHAQV
jgi:hypothetical protein